MMSVIVDPKNELTKLMAEECERRKSKWMPKGDWKDGSIVGDASFPTDAEPLNLDESDESSFYYLVWMHESTRSNDLSSLLDGRLGPVYIFASECSTLYKCGLAKNPNYPEPLWTEDEREVLLKETRNLLKKMRPVLEDYYEQHPGCADVLFSWARLDTLGEEEPFVGTSAFGVSRRRELVPISQPLPLEDRIKIAPSMMVTFMLGTLCSALRCEKDGKLYGAFGQSIVKTCSLILEAEHKRLAKELFAPDRSAELGSGRR